MSLYWELGWYYNHNKKMLRWPTLLKVPKWAILKNLVRPGKFKFCVFPIAEGWDLWKVEMCLYDFHVNSVPFTHFSEFWFLFNKSCLCWMLLKCFHLWISLKNSSKIWNSSSRKYWTMFCDIHLACFSKLPIAKWWYA